MVVVAHLDHTDERGGAELALARLLGEVPGWTPHLFFPSARGGSGGAFDGVRRQFITEIGVPQPAGAIDRGYLGKVALLGRVVMQALAVRANRTFRRSDVVHANTSRAALIGYFACAGSHRRLVVHLRDAVEADALGTLNAKLLAFTVSRAAGVIANSDYTLRSAARYFSSHTQTSVIPSPVGLLENRDSMVLNDHVSTIGMLARISEWKGQELLIRAFADSFRDSSVQLQLAGSPAFGSESYLAHLKRLVLELGVAKQVLFLGHIADIWPLIDSWDICVHASLRSEPMGQNVLQYLAACRPTVAANAGGPVEWIKHETTGILFEPGSQQALSAALRRLFEDRELRINLSKALSQERPVPTDANIRMRYEKFFETVCFSALNASNKPVEL